MFFSRIFSLFAMCFCVCTGLQAAYAEETLEKVLARHAIDKPVEFAYLETRRMKFFDDPVEASGMMYVSSSHFVVHQQKPYRFVMVSSETNMWFFDSEHQIKRKGSIRAFAHKDSAIGALAFVMRTGDVSLLDKHYQVEFKTVGDHWEIALSPRQKNNRPQFSKLVLQGLVGEYANAFTSVYADGDDTTWEMYKRSDKSGIASTMKTLIKEAGGW